MTVSSHRFLPTRRSPAGRRGRPRRPLLAVLGVIISAAAVALPACSASHDDGQTIKVGTLRGQPHLYQPYFYNAHAVDGLKFEVITFDSAPDIKTAVVSGGIDFGIAGVPAALSGLANGEDIKVIASAADGGSSFVADDSITDIRALAGKNVGYPQGSSQEILLRLTLENAGVAAEDLNLVNLPFSDMANALSSGRISAFLSAETGPSIAIQDGARPLISPYDTPVGKINIALLTTGKLIDENPELVQKVVDTHKAAVDYMLGHKDEWADGVVDTFGLDRAVVATAIDNIWLRSDLSPQYQAQAVALAQQMKAINILPSVPSAEDIFDTRFVQ